MTDLYLIAHRVRGEPAFDIATRMECPECTAQGCNECDSLGYWWIIPTSGHRAYPWWSGSFEDIGIDRLADWNWGAGRTDDNTYRFIIPGAPSPDVPDHYPHALTPDAPKRNLIDLLNLRPKSAPTTPFPRRI